MSNNNKAPIDYKIIEGNLNDSIKNRRSNIK